MKVIKYHLFNAYHLQSTVFVNVTSHLLLTATLKKRSYDPQWQETEELRDRIRKVQLSHTNASLSYGTSTGSAFQRSNLELLVLDPSDACSAHSITHIFNSQPHLSSSSTRIFLDRTGNWWFVLCKSMPSSLISTAQQPTQWLQHLDAYICCGLGLVLEAQTNTLPTIPALDWFMQRGGMTPRHSLFLVEEFLNEGFHKI